MKIEFINVWKTERCIFLLPSLAISFRTKEIIFVWLILCIGIE